MDRQRIVLIRHGRSALTYSRGFANTAGVERFRAAYDAAGIAPDSIPPPESMAVVAAADVVMASDMQRAIESARRLAPGRQIEISPLLREMAPPLPAWTRVQMPLEWWGYLIHVRWGFRILRGTHAPAADMERAARAASMLHEKMNDLSLLAVVTHGTFRRLVSHQLTRLGWRVDAYAFTNEHWSLRALSRER